MGSKQWELTQLDLCTVSISFTLATPLMCQLQLCGDLSLTLTDVCKLGPFFSVWLFSASPAVDALWCALTCDKGLHSWCSLPYVHPHISIPDLLVSIFQSSGQASPHSWVYIYYNLGLFLHTKGITSHSAQISNHWGGFSLHCPLRMLLNKTVVKLLFIFCLAFHTELIHL